MRFSYILLIHLIFTEYLRAASPTGKLSLEDADIKVPALSFHLGAFVLSEDLESLYRLDPKAQKMSRVRIKEAEAEVEYFDILPTAFSIKSLAKIVPLKKPNSWLFYDALDQRLLYYEMGAKHWAQQSTIVLDQLKAARDSRGEPTVLENRRLRQRMAKAYGPYEWPAIRIPNFAAFPAKFKFDPRDGAYLSLVSIGDIGFATMACDFNLNGGCQLKRACFSEHPSKLELSQASDLALYGRKNWILALIPETRTIAIFQYQSCYHIPYLGKLSLDPKIKSPHRISIDREDQLWIGSEAPDDYSNAQIYRFPRKIWDPN